MPKEAGKLGPLDAVSIKRAINLLRKSTAVGCDLFEDQLLKRHEDWAM